MNDERHFLHDIIGPLSNAQAFVDIYIEELRQNPASTEHLKRLEAILSSIEKVTDLVGSRREYLVEKEQP